MAADDQPKKYPAGIFGLLAEMRDLDVISRLPGGWAKVFLALYSRRNETGHAWPSQRTLAQNAGVDERTVRRFIRWAKVALGVRIRRGRCNEYYLPLNEKIDPFLSDHALSGNGRPRRKAENRTAEHPQRTEGQKNA